MKAVASAILIGSGLISMSAAQPHPGGQIGLFAGAVVFIVGVVLCIKTWKAAS